MKVKYNRKTRIEYACFKHDVYEYGIGSNKYCIIKHYANKKVYYTHKTRRPYAEVIDGIYFCIAPEMKNEVKTTETFNFI